MNECHFPVVPSVRLPVVLLLYNVPQFLSVYYRDGLFTPVICALSGMTFLPIILAFILAVLSTGYSRDILYFYHITKCVGGMFTVSVSGDNNLFL